MLELERIEEIKRAWERFTQERVVPPVETVRDFIVRSWIRCRDYGVDPYKKIVSSTLSSRELEKKLQINHEFLDICIPVMRNLYEFVKGSGFVVALIDAEGYILKIMGDQKVAVDGARGNLIEGAYWSEDRVGTSVATLPLIEDKPIQIVACEHYCQNSHRWTASGAPIHNPEGKTLGAISMSARYHLVHSHTLGMVVAAANAIEKQLVLNKTMRKLQLENCTKEAIIEGMNDGLIAIDQANRIVLMNRSSAKIFNTSISKAIDMPIEQIDPGEPFMNLVHANEEAWDVYVDIKNRNNQYVVTTKGIVGGGGKAGRVIIINEQKRMQRVAQHLAGATARITFEDLIGKSQAFRSVIEIAERAAKGNSNVLILGESGTGKDLIAQAIHNASEKKSGPFVAVNCAALPRDLIASELFGYNEGAFTGARKGGNPGKFELADGGTIFLDEIGDMPLNLQTTLLRVIEDRTIMRVGGSKNYSIDVRIIAATNSDLSDKVKGGIFRSDLFYRLNVVQIRVPPLRERAEDIPLLLDHFINKMASQSEKGSLNVLPQTIRILMNYHWPGNIRQLQNLVERSYSIGNGEMILPESEGGKEAEEVEDETVNLYEMERVIIQSLLTRSGYNIASVARSLGVARSTVYRKMKRYGIKMEV